MKPGDLGGTAWSRLAGEAGNVGSAQPLEFYQRQHPTAVTSRIIHMFEGVLPNCNMLHAPLVFCTLIPPYGRSRACSGGCAAIAGATGNAHIYTFYTQARSLSLPAPLALTSDFQDQETHCEVYSNWFLD